MEGREQGEPCISALSLRHFHFQHCNKLFAIVTDFLYRAHPAWLTMASKLRPTYAFRKRLELLSSGTLHLKEAVKCITVSYRTSEFSSRGLRYICDYYVSLVGIILLYRQFISTKLPPVQFKNPEVQIVLFKNAHHFKFPAVKVYFSRLCVHIRV